MNTFSVVGLTVGAVFLVAWLIKWARDGDACEDEISKWAEKEGIFLLSFERRDGLDQGPYTITSNLKKIYRIVGRKGDDEVVMWILFGFRNQILDFGPILGGQAGLYPIPRTVIQGGFSSGWIQR